MSKIFISYSHNDMELAERVVSLLEGEFDIWWDEKILPGEMGYLRIDHELETADWVMVLFTKDSIKSEWVLNEATKALGKAGARLLPLKFDGCEIPLDFRRRQSVDIDRGNPDASKGWRKLLDRLRNPLETSEPHELDKGSRPIPASPEVAAASGETLKLPPPELPAEEEVEVEDGTASPAIAFLFTPQDLNIADGAYLLRKALKSHTIGDIRATARSGQAEAQMLMGIAASEGHEVDRNPDDAGRWLRLAAEQNHPRALAEYAWYLGQVLRVRDSPDAVVEALQNARDAGTTRGRTVFATHRLDGFKVGISKAKAVELLKTSAGEGDMLAATVLGWALASGRGVRRNAAEAARWLKDASEHGNALAQANYGRLLWLGRGVPFDPARAVYWFERSARQGHVWGEYFYAWAFEHGAVLSRDLAEARYWYERSAQQGDCDAQLAVARLYLEGQGGARDVEKARFYLEKAATRDDVRAYTMLGELYEDGIGVDVDLVEAISLYRKAADRSEPRAALKLGLMYDWGRGVDHDLSKARHYLAIAADQYGDVTSQTAAERKLAFIGR
jgi:TPR repeat protein